MSMTTSSPSPIIRSPGSEWGSAPFGPEPTIASNEGPEPSSRIRCSADWATSRSVFPARPRSARNSIDLVGKARSLGDRLDLLRVLSPAELLDESRRRNQGGAVGHGLLELSERRDAGRVLVVSDLAGEALGELGHEAPFERLPVEIAGDLRPRPLGVAEVGEELAASLADDREAARAGEAGEPADVRDRVRPRIAWTDEVPDEEAVELGLGDQGGEAVAPRAPGQAPSSVARRPSASR